MRFAARKVHVAVMVLLTSLATTVSTVPAATAAPPASPSRAHPQVEPLAWAPCDDGFSCATYTVPLDYDHPDGRQISLALNKLPATDPARRIGSLFVNPGGPGGSGVDFVHDLGARLFTPEVRSHFDIVGFDPRGVWRSSPLRCFDTVEEAAEATLLPFPYPNSPEKRQAWIAADRRLSEACERRGGPILDHMSTAHVARDLDRLRQAVGDDELTYYGVSYGSFLGTTYANLFPGRFRALVVDGVLDPIGWTTGRGDEGRRVPVNLRVGAATGPQATVEEFFRLCDAGGPRCAFAPHSARRHAALYRALRREPLLLPQEDGTTVTYDESFLVADTLFSMFDPATWPDLAATLAELEKGVSPTQVSARLRSLRQGFATTEDYQNYFEGYPGVLCSESTNPTEYRAWDREVRRSLRHDGIYGPLPAWYASVCARLAGTCRRPLRRPVHPSYGAAGAGRREPLRPRHPVRGGRPGRRPAAQVAAADGRRVGPYLVVQVVLRRRGDRSLPADHGAARARCGVPGGRGAVHGAHVGDGARESGRAAADPTGRAARVTRADEDACHEIVDDADRDEITGLLVDWSAALNGVRNDRAGTTPPRSGPGP